MTTEGKCN